MNITKKAAKQLRKLPKGIQRAAEEAAAPGGPFGTMLDCSGAKYVSIRLPHSYRIVLERGTREIIFAGTHESYNKMVRNGRRL